MFRTAFIATAMAFGLTACGGGVKGDFSDYCLSELTGTGMGLSASAGEEACDCAWDKLKDDLSGDQKRDLGSAITKYMADDQNLTPAETQVFDATNQQIKACLPM